MLSLYLGLAVLLTAVLATASFALLVERGGIRGVGDRWVSRRIERWVGRRALTGWDWRAVAAVLGGGYALIAAFDLAHGFYACVPGAGPSDLQGLLASGRAFWSGGNPFDVYDCGTPVVLPYGIAAVVLDAVGSLGGAPGIAAVWGIVGLALVPLVWLLADGEARYATTLLAASPIYLPVIAGEVDGASNAIVPVGVLLAILLARRRGSWAAAVGGLLSTARFPALFALLAASGGRPRRRVVAGVAIAAFAAGTALAFARWRTSFLNAVFLSQASRHAFSLNAFGILLNAHALPGGLALPVGQAVATLAVTLAAFLTVRSPVRAAAIALTAVALLTQFLSFPILLWLVPVVLVGGRERWWLWAISVVGSVNFYLALDTLGWGEGIYGPTDLLDGVVTVLLLALLIELWRNARTDDANPSAGLAPAAPGG
ncbi:MAG TPA: hypothetical protein VML94_04885 [Thermoplasmata archaeon]|nr:hypothetical protein [Thermoplasmata archaeon]